MVPLLTVCRIMGSMVLRWTFSSSQIPTRPLRAFKPKTGGLSSAAVPRPRLPFRRRRRGFRCFFLSLRVDLCAQLLNKVRRPLLLLIKLRWGVSRKPRLATKKSFDGHRFPTRPIHEQSGHWKDLIPLSKGIKYRLLRVDDAPQRWSYSNHHTIVHTLCIGNVNGVHCYCDDHGDDKKTSHNGDIVLPQPNATPVPSHSTSDHRRSRK